MLNASQGTNLYIDLLREKMRLITSKDAEWQKVSSLFAGYRHFGDG
ncbi:hypothetical protein ACFLUO_05120 [Chloroflexota bacterium]